MPVREHDERWTIRVCSHGEPVHWGGHPNTLGGWVHPNGKLCGSGTTRLVEVVPTEGRLPRIAVDPDNPAHEVELRDDCEHGYRAAGGSFDCPVCQAQRQEPQPQEPEPEAGADFTPHHLRGPGPSSQATAGSPAHRVLLHRSKS